MDGLKASIAKVSCYSFSSLLNSSSWYRNPSLDWLQAIFTSWEPGVYLKGTILTRWYIAAQDLVPGFFQIGISVVALQRAFLGHYLPNTAESWASSLSGSTSTSSLGICPTYTRVIPGSMSSPVPLGVP